MKISLKITNGNKSQTINCDGINIGNYSDFITIKLCNINYDTRQLIGQSDMREITTDNTKRDIIKFYPNGCFFDLKKL